MEPSNGMPRPASLNIDSAQLSHNNVSNRKSSSAMSSPLSSTPATPNLQNRAFDRRSSQTPTLPAAHSPTPTKALRRASSAMSMNGARPSPSPGLRKKTSRSSLCALQAEDADKRPTPKRSISNLITGLREAHSKMEAIEEPVPLTAPQIAVEHFARELIAHSQPACESETMVLLHDACYGHRYSRLKTTKSTLSMIVERPERIHASILGASTAYVRLGGHHAGAINAPHPDIAEAAPPPFKIRRTGRDLDITSSYVTNVHGTAWMSELKGLCDAAGERLAAGFKELTRATGPTEPEKKKLHEGDLYLSPESLNAFQGALGGVADAVDEVFNPTTETKRAFVAVRPPGHHCSADHPSGFCWLNNVHVGIEYAAQIYGLTHAAILDFDLHHGDGSQAITWARNSKNNEKRLNAKPNSKLKLAPDVGYYSLHDINSYPCEMGDDEKVQAASLCIDNAHGQSIWNVHLEEWKTMNEFWELYEHKYSVLLEKTRKFLRHHTRRIGREGKAVPKAAVFISAGFDASEWEGAGMQRHKVNVPTEFYARFTRDVVALAKEEDLGCEGRVISVLEGGYSDRALCSGVLSHLSGLCTAPVRTSTPGLAGSMPLDQMMRGLGINGTSPDDLRLQYDTNWWSDANLTALEHKINPPPPAVAKKMRVGPQPTYATPTESFAYKVVDTDKFARSISGTMREVARPARPPTPPAPEVDWVVATQELSKLLIPTDRQTHSCTPEELAGPKTQRVRTSGVTPANIEAAAVPRQLRDRKAKGPHGYTVSEHSDELESVRSVSRSSRRQTIADLPLANSDPVENATSQRRASRRLSAGSMLSVGAQEADMKVAPPMPALPAQAGAKTMKPPPLPGAVQVKKTRAPLASGVTGAGVGAVAKTKRGAGAVASAPVSPGRSRSAAPASSAATTVPVQPASGLPTNGATARNGDLDALTTGMKRISLKVGTKEEHDRKQKERIDAERRARALKGAETRRNNAAARKAAAAGANAGGKDSVNTIPAPAPAPVSVPAPPAANAVDERPSQKMEMSYIMDAPPATTNSTDAAPVIPFGPSTGFIPPADVPLSDTIPLPATHASAQGPLEHGPQPPPVGGATVLTFSPAEWTAFEPATLQQPVPMVAHQEVPFAPEASMPASEMAVIPPPPDTTTLATADPAMKPEQVDFQPSTAGLEMADIASDQPASLPNNIKGQGSYQLPVWNSTGPIPFAKAESPSIDVPPPATEGLPEAVPAGSAGGKTYGYKFVPVMMSPKAGSPKAGGKKSSGGASGGNVWNVPGSPKP